MVFTSLLIANRGEIACRIIRTARRMGIRTIAVYSEADAQALHVKHADVAIPIGPAPAKQSYLDGERIIEAARQAGAEAIHPGYGFLSENADFAEAVIQAGLIWVGPPAAAIRAMGLKDAAKQRMIEAGVPVTPGYHGADQSDARLQNAAEDIGYPVLIKAVAGGGGKGMRKVDGAEAFLDALASCRREAKASFGDDRVLIEKYVSAPRHIEVQVFADSHGNAVHLFERDCSLQRRHQKVIEEAPAPSMDTATRGAICTAAVRAAQAVKYEGAGTVEFIADASAGLRADRIWFMEMNTRLQVEHPVTEMITGIDLVEWQLRVAAGETLPLRQADISITGHALEARLYAENPDIGFLPSIGALTHFWLPYHVRVDTGVGEGDTISAFYDPMIAKLIVHAPTRRAAAEALAETCAAVEVWPVKTNAAFLARVAGHPDFVAGRIDTGFIPRHADDLLPQQSISNAVLQAAAQAWIDAQYAGDADGPWAQLPGFRLNAAPAVEVCLARGQDRFDVVRATGAPDLGAAVYGDTVVVFEHGAAIEFHPPRFEADDAGVAALGAVSSPMPGRVINIQAPAGTKVDKGTALITVEAMKMEYVLMAAFRGTVEAVLVKIGDAVSEGQTLQRLSRGQ